VADAQWADVLERDGLHAFLAAWQSLPLFASQQDLPEKVREQQRAWRLAHDPNGLAWSLRTLSLGCMPAWGPRLCEIHVPVRLVVGALDDKFGTLATWAACRLPQGQVWRVEKSGHNVVLEQPSAIAELLWGELEA
jgi:pimeloyl-ACP methyl ester carboxylesterase